MLGPKGRSRLLALLRQAGPVRFGWVLDKLAGSGRPGRYAPLEEDLAFLRAEAVSVIVSLLETSQNLPEYRRAGFAVHHFPVEDFQAPEIEQIIEACAAIDQAIEEGERVLVHCNAGIGRTGALLACYLVHRGQEPDTAIRRIRRTRPYSLETREQENVVWRYHQQQHSREAD